MIAFAPFDNTRTVRDESGNYVRYLIDPLAETYLVPPGAAVCDGMLPPEEFEVRRALLEMKLLTEHVRAFSWLSRIFGSVAYREARDAAAESQKALLCLVNSTHEHKAAIRRIVNAMPPNNGGRESLLSLTQ